MEFSSLHSTVRPLMKLLNIAEEMIFSIGISDDIVKKYQGIRENVFRKLGLISGLTKYWELQRKAQHDTEIKKQMQNQEKNQLKTMLENSNKNISLSLTVLHSVLDIFDSNLKETGILLENKPIYDVKTEDFSKYPEFLSYFESTALKISKNYSIALRENENYKITIDSLLLSNKNMINQIYVLEDQLDELKNNEEQYIIELENITKNNISETNKINELEYFFQEKETRLLRQIDRISCENFSDSKLLNEKLEKKQRKNRDLKDMIKTVSERILVIFNEFVDRKEATDRITQRKVESAQYEDEKILKYDDMLIDIDFIGYTLHKIKGDNQWLVEQLGCIYKENDELKNRLNTAASFKSNQKILENFR